MILCIEKPKDDTRKLLELIHEFSKFSHYKINTQKSVAFLCTNNEKVKREIQETMKYLGINLSKETKYLYSENYKILLKEI